MRAISLQILALTLFLGACDSSPPPSAPISPAYPTSPRPSPEPEPSVNRQAEAEPKFDWKGDAPALSANQPHAVHRGALESLTYRQQIYCQGPCPEGVGVLFAVQADAKVSRCTAFLIENDVLATNSHCVPADLRNKGSRGRGRMLVKLPRFDESIEVDFVIHASDLSKKDRLAQDYAFLNLKYPARAEPLKVTREGIGDGHSYDIWRVDEEKGIFPNSFLISRLTCQAKQGTGLFPQFRQDQSPLAIFNRCHIVQGNSGSPVLNARGEAVGIMSAYFRVENTSVGALMKPEDLIKLPRVAFASNFACIDDFRKNRKPLAEACGEDLSMKAQAAEFWARYNHSLRGAGKDLDAQVQHQISQWVEQHSKVFKWKIVPVASSSSSADFFAATYANPPVKAEIECLQNPEGWLGNFTKRRFFYETEAKLVFENYIWGVNVGADQAFNFAPQASAFLGGYYDVVFNPREIANTRRTKVTIIHRMKILDKEFPISMQKELEICPATTAPR